MSNPPFRYFKIQISYNEIPLDKTRSDVKQIVCIFKLIYFYGWVASVIDFLCCNIFMESDNYGKNRTSTVSANIRCVFRG
jgi:hypothetical protein